MKTSMKLLPLALAAALFTISPVLAQDVGDDVIVEQASVPKAKLVERYTALAGSTDAAEDLVSDLRSGGDFTVSETVTTTTTNPDGTTTTTTAVVDRTVVNPNGKMGWGEVNISLSLAQALLDSGNAATLQSALTGVTTTTTNPDGTTTTTTTGGVLAMRADGMGWGAISKELGFKLGSLISAGNRKADAASPRATNAERASAKADRATAKPERVAKVDRPARPDRPERMSRPERPERPQKPERGGR